MKIEEAQGKIDPGYGVCIYCGSDGGTDGLRDEHVVTFSLIGNCVIRNASCVSCQNKINQADTYLSKSAFYHLRLHINAQTRNPKDRPDTIKTKVSIDTSESLVDFPRTQSPFSRPSPLGGARYIAGGKSIYAPFPAIYVNVYHYVPDNMRGVLGIGNDTDYSVWATQKINPYLFARAVAKIAYCYMLFITD